MYGREMISDAGKGRNKTANSYVAGAEKSEKENRQTQKAAQENDDSNLCSCYQHVNYDCVICG